MLYLQYFSKIIPCYTCNIVLKILYIDPFLLKSFSIYFQAFSTVKRVKFALNQSATLLVHHNFDTLLYIPNYIISN